MKTIGILSDTHGYFDPALNKFFSECDEIWHAGDIGSIELVKEIRKTKPLRAVYGNIDGQDIRTHFSKDLRFFCEDIEVWVTHIGGYPGRYDRMVKETIKRKPPDLFVCGHSHILKVMYDKDLELLHINPGAAGRAGLHKIRTAIRLRIDKSDIKDLEVIELGNRSKL